MANRPPPPIPGAPRGGAMPTRGVPSSRFVPGNPAPPGYRGSPQGGPRGGGRASRFAGQAFQFAGNAGLTGAAMAASNSPKGKSRIDTAKDYLKVVGTPEALTAATALGAAQVVGQAAKWSVTSSPYNLDTEINQRLSQEGRLTYMGRGIGEPTPVMIRTDNNYQESGPRNDRDRGRIQNVRQAGPMDSWAAPVGTPMGRPSPASPGYGHPAGQGGASPGYGPPPTRHAGPWANPPAHQDYLHEGSTSGTGAPWFDTHVASTSGINQKPVTNVQAAEDDKKP